MQKGVRSLSQEDPLEKELATPSRKSHGQKRLAGYSLWGCRVGHDLVTKPLPHHHVLLFVFLIWELVTWVCPMCENSPNWAFIMVMAQRHRVYFGGDENAVNGLQRGLHISVNIL